MFGSCERSHEFLDLRVAADEFACRAARRAVAGLALPAGPVRDDAILLTSELVANAVRHSGQRDGVIEVRVFGDGRRLRIAVSNRVGIRDIDRTRRAWDVDGVEPATTSGWGLQLVEILATRWGTVHVGGWTTVWFEVRPYGSG